MTLGGMGQITTNIAEKREHERLRWPVRAMVMDAMTNRIVTADAHIRNVGAGGFSILTDSPLAMRGTYRFKLFFNAVQPLILTGRVVSAKRESILQTSGISVEPASLTERIQYRRFVAQRIPSIMVRGWVKAVLTGVVAGVVGSVGLGLSADVTAISAFVITCLFAAFPVW